MSRIQNYLSGPQSQVSPKLTGRYQALGIALIATTCWLQTPALFAQLEEDDKASAADGAGFDQFGTAVAISGWTAVVGAPRDDDDGSSSGSAYVFEFDGLMWTQVAKLTASDATAADMFGSSVAIDGDVVVVGAPFSDHVLANAGAAYLFQKPGTSWINMTETATLDYTIPDKGDGFGSAVAIDNNQVVVGSPQAVSNLKGKVFLYEMPGTGWETMTETAILKASRPRNGDRTGAAVSIVNGIVAVGVPGCDILKPDAGMVLVFEEPIDGWVSATESAAVWADDLTAGDQLGYSVSTTGAAIAAGAPFHDAAGSDAGAAYLFKAGKNGWRNTTQLAKIMSSISDPIDEFGASIAMEPDVVVVGAHKADVVGTNAGAAFVYYRPFNGWTEAVENNYVIASDAANADGFGTSLASDNALTIIGSPFDDDRGADSGSIYSLDLTPDCLELEVYNLIAGRTATFVVRNGTPGQRFLVVYGLGGPDKTYINVRGYCATFGFSYIGNKNVLGSAIFNQSGNGTFDLPIAEQMIGFTLKLQAAEKNTCPDECVSNIVKEEVQ